MQDSDLKKLLLETCQTLPGQEARAWNALRDRLYSEKSPALSRSPLRYFFASNTRIFGTFACACAIVFAACALASHLRPISYASADSEAPGIYATSFYSSSAKAQVVWLDGMDPATDQPTYQDPTTDISSIRKPSQPAGGSNSL